MTKGKKSKPSFNVPNSSKKRIKSRWRKPRGIDNKKRIRRVEFGACPKVGYKNSPETRGKHPLGLEEILVANIRELTEMTDSGKEKYAVRIAGQVSKRNKQAIRDKAKEFGLRVLN